MGENTTGETILPGHARFYRDGDLVGDGVAAADPAGGRGRRWPSDRSTTCGLRGSTCRSTRATAASSSRKTNNAAGRILGRKHLRQRGTVRLLYAVPFAEQEDIEVDVQFTRAPDETDVDDLRGVSAWDLTSHRVRPRASR
jgi:hypothetical protein